VLVHAVLMVGGGILCKLRLLNVGDGEEGGTGGYVVLGMGKRGGDEAVSQRGVDIAVRDSVGSRDENGLRCSCTCINVQ
jgi:hypothetical protein